MTALQHQGGIQPSRLPSGASLAGLIVACGDGSPLGPQWVLDQLRRRTAEAELPTLGLHDLRHDSHFHDRLVGLGQLLDHVFPHDRHRGIRRPGA
jgi:hypothetical protein